MQQRASAAESVGTIVTDASGFAVIDIDIDIDIDDSPTAQSPPHYPAAAAAAPAAPVTPSALTSPLTHKNLEAHVRINSPKQIVLPRRPESVSTGSLCDVCNRKQTKIRNNVKNNVLLICQMVTCKRAFHPACVQLAKVPKTALLAQPVSQYYLMYMC
jgi:hypothetical protein